MPHRAIDQGWSAVPGAAVPRGNKPPAKGQKLFDKLVARLKAQRRELAKWQTFKQAYHDRLSGEYQPLARRLRETRIETARLLDQAMERKQLKKRERDMVWETLRGLLIVLLADEEDPELVALHDKYADVSFEDERRQQMALMRTSAIEDFGVDAADYEGADLPEELAAWIAEQARTKKSRGDPVDAAAEPERSGRAAGREAREERMVEDGARSLRDVFRKLVSEFHPDREPNPAERARKTALMQKVNTAYKAGDLFTLLEMQRDGGRAVIAAVPEERFRHYNHMLERQSLKLREELLALVSPFEIAIGDALTRKITPDDVKRALEADIVQLKGVLRTVEMDQAHFKDLLRLKPSLAHYRETAFDDGLQRRRRRRQ